MLKVAIVEDDPNIAQLHCHFISQLNGYAVIGIAGTKALATQLIAHSKPDLVIVDNYLPDGLGVELVIDWLSSEHKPECILVTAANDANTVQLAHRYGAFDYLVKPIDYQRLIESLQRFAQIKHHLGQGESFRQAQLDGLFHPAYTTETVIANSDPFTLKQVIALFNHSHIEHTAHSVANELGVSKSTARRYLDKATECGELEAFLAHGKVGRPTRFYRRLNPLNR